MNQVKIYLTLDVDDIYFDDDCYESSMEYIKEKIRELADGVEAHIVDLEIK